MYSVSQDFLTSVSGDRELDYDISIGSLNLKTDAALTSVVLNRVNQSASNIIGNANPVMCDIIFTGVASDARCEGEDVAISLGLQVNGSYEYVPMTPMKVESASYSELNKTWTVHCCDALYYANSKTIGEISFTYPITYHGYIEAVCSALNISLGTDTFTNSTMQLLSAPNFSGSETLLYVISKFAEAVLCNVYIGRDKDQTGRDVLFLKSIINSSAPYDLGYKYMNCTRGATYGPINTLVLSREPQGDNVYASDVDEGESPIELRIADNPFLDYGANDTRYDIIHSLFSIINTLTLCAYNLSYRGNWALDCFDNISLTATDGTTFTALYAGDVITYNGGISAVSEFKAFSQTQTDLRKAASLKSVVKDTFLRIDKQEGLIEQLLTDTRRISDALVSLSNTVTSNAEKTDIVISKTGGSNMLRNSAFFKQINSTDEADPWQLSPDALYNVLQETSTEQQTDSGSELVLIKGSLSQTYTQIVGETYTFACLIRNTNEVQGKTTYIRIYRNDNDYVEIPNSGLSYGRRTKLTYTYTASASAPKLVIYTDNDSTALSVADIRVVKGDASQEWSQHTSEIYGAGILIDNSGVEIKSLSGGIETSKLDSDSLVFKQGNTIVSEVSDEKISAPKLFADEQMKIGGVVFDKVSEGRLLIYADTD